MAKASKVTPSLETNIYCDNEDDDSDEDNDDDIASLNKKGEMVFHVLRKNKNACSYFAEILTIAIESKKLIKEHEETIFEMEGHAREYADEIADLNEALVEEQTTKESLEETFALELSKVKETHDRALEVANSLQTKNDELVVVYAKLLEDFEHLKNGSRVVKGELIKLTESHEQLKASYSKELTKLPSPLVINDDACATNSISCEASILKENVELSAQLELLANNYEKLEESHEKLFSSDEDLLVSHDRLKLAHEAILTKLTSCESHVDISTTSTQNTILSCASPINSSSHIIAKSCDELISLPCCSNNEASTFSSTCVDTNHVEKIK